MTARNDVSSSPLLSICIPCYNGGRYLPVVLEALLPQVRQAGERVELLLVDDGSTDHTADVVKLARKHGPLRFIRNPTNLGMARNIASAITRHATGEFVWVLSQHNLFTPGGLEIVLRAISANRHLDAFYINFRCATFPEDWPASAMGGYNGRYEYLCRTDLVSREVPRWEDLLDARTSVCTQTYSHIARRSVVSAELSTQSIGTRFETALDAYTQTWAVAHAMFGKPAYYIGDPIMTIYNGAQTWGSLTHRAHVHLQAYPDLLRIYSRLGWRGRKLRDAQLAGNKYAGIVMTEILGGGHREERRLVAQYLRRYWSYEGIPQAFWLAFTSTRKGPVARAARRGRAVVASMYDYFFSNWRPARWVRAHLK